MNGFGINNDAVATVMAVGNVRSVMARVGLINTI